MKTHAQLGVKHTKRGVVRMTTIEHRFRRLLVWMMTLMVLVGGTLRQVAAMDGSLDLSFGIGGKVSTAFANNGDFASAVAIQNDGKIIVVGQAQVTNGDFALARYDRNGNLDSSFGIGGKVIADFSGGNEVASAVALQSDGKIVVAGTTQGNDFSSADFALARYETSGSLDSSFGVGGRVTTDFFGTGDGAQAMVIQHDGDIVVAGFATHGNESFNFALARYDSNGNLDTGFGVGGKVSTDFNANVDHAFSMALQADGRIVVAGLSSSSFALARYNNNGDLDSGFGTGGKVIVDHLSSFGVHTAIALQGNGKIVAAGYVGFYDFALIRYNSNGSLDTSFGTGGRVITNLFGGSDFALAVVIQTDGRIIVGGESARPLSFSDFVLARYDINGNLDSSFGVAGKVTTDFLGSSDSIRALALQSDGKLVAAGIAFQGTVAPPKFAVARYDIVSFDLCLQDDSSGSLLRINSTTGEYLFTNCSGFTLGGIGSLTAKGSILSLQHNAADRRVTAKIDASVKKGSASVQVFGQGTTFTITDRNTANNTCACTAAAH